MIQEPQDKIQTAEQLMLKINLGRQIGCQKFRESVSKGTLDDEILVFNNFASGDEMSADINGQEKDTY